MSHKDRHTAAPIRPQAPELSYEERYRDKHDRALQLFFAILFFFLLAAAAKSAGGLDQTVSQDIARHTECQRLSSEDQEKVICHLMAEIMRFKNLSDSERTNASLSFDIGGTELGIPVPNLDFQPLMLDQHSDVNEQIDNYLRVLTALKKKKLTLLYGYISYRVHGGKYELSEDFSVSMFDKNHYAKWMNTKTYSMNSILFIYSRDHAGGYGFSDSYTFDASLYGPAEEFGAYYSGAGSYFSRYLYEKDWEKFIFRYLPKTTRYTQSQVASWVRRNPIHFLDK